jgi:antitoxin component YwqK of YwqJK toxin-antitoxin module
MDRVYDELTDIRHDLDDLKVMMRALLAPETTPETTLETTPETTLETTPELDPETNPQDKKSMWEEFIEVGSRKHGKHTIYTLIDDNPEDLIICNWKDGVLDGEYFERDSEELSRLSGQYANGIPSGIWTWLNDDDSVLRTENHTYDGWVFERTVFNQCKILVKTMFYTNKISSVTTYNLNGTPSTIRHKLNGIPHGKYISYMSDGRTSVSGEYKNGKMYGNFYYYRQYAPYVKHMQKTFKDDKLLSVSSFDEQGNLDETTTYP